MVNAMSNTLMITAFYLAQKNRQPMAAFFDFLLHCLGLALAVFPYVVIIYALYKWRDSH